MLFAEISVVGLVATGLRKGSPLKSKILLASSASNSDTINTERDPHHHHMRKTVKKDSKAGKILAQTYPSPPRTLA